MIDLVKFEDFEEFLKRRKMIQVYYVLLSYNQKREYKKYIYSLPYKESVKDIIWCYLNEPAEYREYLLELLNLGRLYARNKNCIKL